MKFAYSLYYDGCFVLPLVTSAFTVLGLLHATISYFKAITKTNIDAEKTFKYFVLLLAGIYFLFINCGRLIHGGMYLITEKESDAIVIQGEITEIRCLKKHEFPVLESEYGHDAHNGVQFTVDGSECVAISNGNLKVGDYVRVVVLPKSGYILSISQRMNQ